MELRAFAEQVLFGTALEDKLICPEFVTDECPGAPVPTPPRPGRPAHLAFLHSDSTKPRFPSLEGLDRAEDRGRLLHFFANHELLATELMALVLLKFPEAPPAFRQGVLRTLREEQIHTRLYLHRMEQCGISFGDLPVNGFFWRSVAPMENPIDYVAGLCLTFEQANLDYCRHFAQGFLRAGDDATARILDRIYKDEISHVAYGLKWFRRWKQPERSDWEAFCHQLRFPLSPSRAKGITFNVEGRQAAGLDPAFISQLQVHAQSRGRTPNVYLFNPFAEAVIAQGSRYHPVKAQSQLAADLAALPQFLAAQDDVVLLPKPPSLPFLHQLRQAGFPLPEFLTAPERGPLPQDHPLRLRKLGGLRPWAWSPDSAARLAPLLPNLTGDAPPGAGTFTSAMADLYSKTWSARFLDSILAQHESASWLCPPTTVGRAVTSVAEALEVISELRKSGHARLALKESYGLAGHNMIRLWEPAVEERQRRWMERSLAHGHPLLVEPWLERVFDFSVHFQHGPAGLKLRGYTQLINATTGQFHANVAWPHPTRRLPGNWPAWFPDHPAVLENVYELYETIRLRLQADLNRAELLGPVGIDAFLFRDPQGRVRLKPIVEINPRYTMGRLTLELMRRVNPGRKGTFRLLNLADRRREGFTDWPAYARHFETQHPLQREGHPVARIQQGGLCLNDPAEAQAYLATFLVANPSEPGAK